MLKCYDCGHIFREEEAKDWSESRGEFWGFPCSEAVSVCPKCGSGYGEIEACKICGDYDAMDYGETVCEDCKKSILKRFESLITKGNFTDDEKEVINDSWEGF